MRGIRTRSLQQNKLPEKLSSSGFSSRLLPSDTAPTAHYGFQNLERCVLLFLLHFFYLSVTQKAIQSPPDHLSAGMGSHPQAWRQTFGQAVSGMCCSRKVPWSVRCHLQLPSKQPSSIWRLCRTSHRAKPLQWSCCAWSLLRILAVFKNCWVPAFVVSITGRRRKLKGKAFS